MNRFRQLHLYLGCVFTPLLLFFAVTGAWQTFLWHRGSKDGTAKGPRIVTQLSEVHQYQRFPVDSGQKHQPSRPFRYFVLAMALGFVVTTVLGVVMAFKFTREKWIVWLCLGAGVVLPVVFLYIGGGIK